MNKNLKPLHVTLNAMSRHVRSQARQIAELAIEVADAAATEPSDAGVAIAPMLLSAMSAMDENTTDGGAVVEVPADDKGTIPTVDTPIPPADDDWTPERRYQPGTVDQILASQRVQEAQDREKAEANRPTGTEIGQITRKLDELTKQLAEQQRQLKAAQDLLKAQQDTLSDQQRQLKTAQDQLGTQQGQLSSIVSQLSGIVGNQGDTVQTLQGITRQLQSQQAYIDDLQNKVLVTVKLNFDTVFRRLDALDHQGV
jgi:Mg2+ and Co2+ transporter CorA